MWALYSRLVSQSGLLFSVFDVLSHSVFVCCCLYVPPLSFMTALEGDLNGCVVISVAQCITRCNVTKPFSSAFKWPLPGFTLPLLLCCLSHAYSHLWRISRCIKCACGWADTARHSQRAPLTDVYLRPGTLAAAKSAPPGGLGSVYMRDCSTRATGQVHVRGIQCSFYRRFSTFQWKYFSFSSKVSMKQRLYMCKRPLEN